MKVNCKVLSHIKLDQSYSLLSVRDISVILELFKAMDVRGEMALDGRKIKIPREFCPYSCYCFSR